MSIVIKNEFNTPYGIYKAKQIIQSKLKRKSCAMYHYVHNKLMLQYIRKIIPAEEIDLPEINKEQPYNEGFLIGISDGSLEKIIYNGYEELIGKPFIIAKHCLENALLRDYDFIKDIAIKDTHELAKSREAKGYDYNKFLATQIVKCQIFEDGIIAGYTTALKAYILEARYKLMTLAARIRDTETLELGKKIFGIGYVEYGNHIFIKD